MKETVFSFVSADGKTTIYVHEYHPDHKTDVKGLIQMEHGLSENKGIYLDTVATFVKRITSKEKALKTAEIQHFQAFAQNNIFKINSQGFGLKTRSLT